MYQLVFGGNFMYTEEYLARHKKHTCQDKHNYSECMKMNYNIPNTCCPYMHMCPLMQHQNMYYGYEMMQAPKFNASIKNNLNYREEESENLFRHPFGHMSYYYDNDHDDYGDYEHHYDDHDDYEDHGGHHNHSSDYYEHEPYDYELSPYHIQAPFMQYPILPQLPYFEDEEEEENEHHHSNE